jgi:hypothetical protein
MAHEWSNQSGNAIATCIRCGIRVRYVVQFKRVRGQESHPRAMQLLNVPGDPDWRPTNGKGLPACKKGGA